LTGAPQLLYLLPTSRPRPVGPGPEGRHRLGTTRPPRAATRKSAPGAASLVPRPRNPRFWSRKWSTGPAADGPWFRCARCRRLCPFERRRGADGNCW